MSHPDRFPLLADSLDAPIACYGSRRITRAEFLADVKALADLLPARRHGLNLCANRYHFLVTFAALLVSEHVNLLPHSAAPQALDDLSRKYDAFRVEDDMARAACGSHAQAVTIPTIPTKREAAVLFTSGSTGPPRAQVKSWGELVGSSRAALKRFGLASRRHDIVATVLAQHSYGFESSVLYALCGPAVVHAGNPLFPADVRAALANMEPPRILAITPLHLEACLHANFDWPTLAFCLCATSPLSREMAAKAERIFMAPMLEIYGSTETGAIASRRTATETAWTPYDGMHLHRADDGFRVSAPFLAAPRMLGDHFELGADGRFEWHGRQSDQIKIAGKRTTLAELNTHLRAIAGVEDGSFILPDKNGKRLAAIVVAPTLEADAIREQLVGALDPVFLPRPLLKVKALKHTATGKLARTELLAHLGARIKNSSAS